MTEVVMFTEKELGIIQEIPIQDLNRPEILTDCLKEFERDCLTIKKKIEDCGVKTLNDEEIIEVSRIKKRLELSQLYLQMNGLFYKLPWELNKYPSL